MDVLKYLLGGTKKEQINIHFEICNFESCVITMLCTLHIFLFLDRSCYDCKTGYTYTVRWKQNKKKFSMRKVKILLI